MENSARLGESRQILVEAFVSVGGFAVRFVACRAGNGVAPRYSVDMPPLILAALVVFLEGLSLSALFPVIHVYCSTLGGAAVWTGVLFALVAAPKIVFNPFWGRCSDRSGRRAVLIGITFGTMCASIGWALAPGLLWLAVARVIGGVFGAQATLASAIAADVTRPERRAGGMALLGVGFGLAFSIGPLLGGVVGNLTPPEGAGPDWGPRMVGWMCAGFQFISLLLSTFVLRETAARRHERQAPALRQILQLLRLAHVTPILFVTLMMTFGLAGLIATFGLYTEERYGWATRDVGMAYATFGLLGALVQGGVRRLTAMAGERALTFGGLVLLLLGLAALAFRLTPMEFWLSVGFVAVGSALATTCLTAMLSHCAPAEEQGALLGLNQSMIGFGRAVGYVVGGGLFAAWGPPAPYACAAVIVAVGCAALGSVPARLAQPTGADGPLDADASAVDMP